MNTLSAEAWVHIIRFLPYADALALRASSAALAHTIRAAQKVWVDRAMNLASLVVHAYVDTSRADLVVEPTPTGYRVGDAHMPRRTFVHEFPSLACRSSAGELHRVESYVAFPPDVSCTLPLGLMGRVERAHGLDVWVETRLASNVGDMYSPDQWPAVFQRHARFLVALRTGGPKRHRGRRTRRWTKVCVT